MIHEFQEGFYVLRNESSGRFFSYGSVSSTNAAHDARVFSTRKDAEKIRDEFDKSYTIVRVYRTWVFS